MTCLKVLAVMIPSLAEMGMMVCLAERVATAFPVTMAMTGWMAAPEMTVSWVMRVPIR